MGIGLQSGQILRCNPLMRIYILYIYIINIYILYICVYTVALAQAFISSCQLWYQFYMLKSGVSQENHLETPVDFPVLPRIPSLIQVQQMLIPSSWGFIYAPSYPLISPLSYYYYSSSTTTTTTTTTTSNLSGSPVPDLTPMPSGTLAASTCLQPCQSSGFMMI